jgi:8-oxo-dGTP diphosphatase
MSAVGERPGEGEYLAGYRPDHYPAFAVTVDLAIFTIRSGVLSVLLVRRGEHPYLGYLALPGGFIRPQEGAEQAAARELAEETGAGTFTGHLEQLRTYADPGRDPRMRVVSVAYVALTPGLPDPSPGGDAAAARWWPVEDLGLALPCSGGAGDDAHAASTAAALAFDHTRILADGLERVRSKLEYTTLAAGFADEPFTLADLRRVYAAVWGSAPDLANFRRKVLATDGFVVEDRRSDSSPSPSGGRPPLLYRRGPATSLHPPMLRR